MTVEESQAKPTEVMSPEKPKTVKSPVKEAPAATAEEEKTTVEVSDATAAEAKAVENSDAKPTVEEPQETPEEPAAAEKEAKGRNRSWKA